MRATQTLLTTILESCALSANSPLRATLNLSPNEGCPETVTDLAGGRLGSGSDVMMSVTTGASPGWEGPDQALTPEDRKAIDMVSYAKVRVMQEPATVAARATCTDCSCRLRRPALAAGFA